MADERLKEAESIVAALDAKEAKRRLVRIMHEADRVIPMINDHLLDQSMSDMAVGHLRGARDVWRTAQRIAIGEI